MNPKTKRFIDMSVLAVTLINIVFFMFTLIKPSTFLLVLTFCAIYTYLIRKRIETS